VAIPRRSTSRAPGHACSPRWKAATSPPPSPSSVAAPGKWTYVIGNLDPERHAADILAFARQHSLHEQGLPVWRERPEHIRKNTIARVPPMPIKELS
jgi:predicted metal-binding protein